MINTLDPKQLKSSDYITLSWGSTAWLTTEMPLPIRRRAEEINDDNDFLEDWNEEVKASSSSDENIQSTSSPSEMELTITGDTNHPSPSDNPAEFVYRKWDTARLALQSGHKDGGKIRERKAIDLEPVPPPTIQIRRWALPRFIRGRHETRAWRQKTRRHNRWLREVVFGIHKRPLFYWYNFPFPRSFFDRRGGFLYLYKPPAGIPETTVGLRFRVTNDRDPRSFVYGTDLAHHGVPWTVPLHYGPIRNPCVRRLLLKDELLSEKILQRCGKLRRRTVKFYTRTSRRYKRIRAARRDQKNYLAYRLHRDTNVHIPLIYALGQPFHLDLSQRSQRFFLLASKNGRDIYHYFKLQLPRGKIPDTSMEYRREERHKDEEETEGGQDQDQRTESPHPAPKPWRWQKPNQESDQGLQEPQKRKNVEYGPLYKGSFRVAALLAI